MITAGNVINYNGLRLQFLTNLVHFILLNPYFDLKFYINTTVKQYWAEL